MPISQKFCEICLEKPSDICEESRHYATRRVCLRMSVAINGTRQAAKFFSDDIHDENTLAPFRVSLEWLSGR
jgi:hypothetical protein